MSNHYKALAAFAASTMLFGATGATYAFWQDRGQFQAESIQTGSLKFSGPAEVSWNVDLTEVQAGDTLTAQVTLDAQLTGNNLTALASAHHNFSGGWISNSQVSITEVTPAELDSPGSPIRLEVQITLPSELPARPASSIETETLIESLGTLTVELQQQIGGNPLGWFDTVSIPLGQIVINLPTAPELLPNPEVELPPSPNTPDTPAAPDTPILPQMPDADAPSLPAPLPIFTVGPQLELFPMTGRDQIG